MRKTGLIMLLGMQCLLSGCAVNTPVVNQYKLDQYSRKPMAAQQANVSILISPPEAAAGYQSEQMYYVKKPYELQAFAKNAWISAPANMLFPLILQTLQDSGYFYAVVASPYADKADYRLDTQLIELEQNFLCKPSAIEMAVKVVLTHVADDRVIASRIIREHVQCPSDSPYGGVIAANQATRAFTAQLSEFILAKIKEDHRLHRTQTKTIAKN